MYRAAHPDADVTAEFAAFDRDTPAAVRAGHRHSQRVKPPMPSSCSPVRS
ncbi:hypothetical protein RA11412_2332 [Rothia aeria]|uniref:Uncharacterized protein n=1 Tax=Rothia aeria TaxID=172042 RepID=A0A2Z5R2D1_9MICC|nr:hypothetical protein RA11412_2332 [Rothia aeria]